MCNKKVKGFGLQGVEQFIIGFHTAATCIFTECMPEPSEINVNCNP